MYLEHRLDALGLRRTPAKERQRADHRDELMDLLREDHLVAAEVRVMQRLTEDGGLQGMRVVAESVYDLAALVPAARVARLDRDAAGLRL